MLAEMHGQDEEENFFKITSIARAKGARVVAVIAGDWHHYNRYYAHELDVHFITSGGGGAFLHPTHVLQEQHLGALARDARTMPQPVEPEAPGVRPGEGWRAGTTTSASSATPRRPTTSSGRRCRTSRTPSSRCRGVTRLRKRKPLQPQAPKCYPEQDPAATC